MFYVARALSLSFFLSLFLSLSLSLTLCSHFCSFFRNGNGRRSICKFATERFGDAGRARVSHIICKAKNLKSLGWHTKRNDVASRGPPALWRTDRPPDFVTSMKNIPAWFSSFFFFFFFSLTSFKYRLKKLLHLGNLYCIGT